MYVAGLLGKNDPMTTDDVSMLEKLLPFLDAMRVLQKEHEYRDRPTLGTCSLNNIFKKISKIDQSSTKAYFCQR